jgi:hypothetical protein
LQIRPDPASVKDLAVAQNSLDRMAEKNSKGTNGLAYFAEPSATERKGLGTSAVAKKLENEEIPPEFFT